MALIMFTAEQMKELESNPYVKRVSEKAITYTDEFKNHFIEEYQKGKPPSQILRDADFEPKILGDDRVKSISRRYRKMAERPEGICDARKGGSGRPRTNNLTPEEQIQRLKHKIKYLEQENAFLKKIEVLDKKARRKQNLKINSKSSEK